MDEAAWATSPWRCIDIDLNSITGVHKHLAAAAIAADSQPIAGHQSTIFDQ